MHVGRSLLAVRPTQCVRALLLPQEFALGRALKQSEKQRRRINPFQMAAQTRDSEATEALGAERRAVNDLKRTVAALEHRHRVGAEAVAAAAALPHRRHVPRVTRAALCAERGAVERLGQYEGVAVER